jgi:hypothetical protein
MLGGVFRSCTCQLKTARAVGSEEAEVLWRLGLVHEDVVCEGRQPLHAQELMREAGWSTMGGPDLVCCV